MRISAAASLCLGVILFAGCETETPAHPAAKAGGEDSSKPSAAPAQETEKPVAAKKTEIGKNVWLETQGKKRRVIVGATIALREGNFGLECLMCRKNTKEHESILAADADAKEIHAALLIAGGEPGAPAYYDENTRELHPPRGMKIKVLVQYEEKGKLHTVRAQDWVMNTRTKKTLAEEWVFAGSKLFADPDGKDKPVYGANSDGGFICIYNSPVALLDLPITNPNKDPEAGREFQPNTQRIPQVGTKVSVILEAVPETPKNSK
jgi:hypothetical protein